MNTEIATQVATEASPAADAAPAQSRFPAAYDPMKVVKAEFLLAVFAKRIAKIDEELKLWAAQFVESPRYALSWANGSAFEPVALQEALRAMSRTIEFLAKTEADNRRDVWTIEQLREVVVAGMMRNRAVPGSSSPTSNLMEAHEIDAWRDLHSNRLAQFFYDAQFQDPEAQAAYEAGAAVRAAEKAEAEKVAAAERVAAKKAAAALKRTTQA